MGIKTSDSHKRFQMEKKFKYKILILLTVFFVFPYNSSSQDIDVDDILNKLERLENNVSDIQKGKFDNLDKSLSSGYISRNEKRIDQIETNLRQNFGTLEEIQNQINLISEKLDLINKDFQSRVLKLEKNFESLEKNSIDLYSSLKSIYLQDRENKINNSIGDQEEWGNLDN